MTFDFIPIKKLNTYYMIIIFLVVFFFFVIFWVEFYSRDDFYHFVEYIQIFFRNYLASNITATYQTYKYYVLSGWGKTD